MILKILHTTVKQSPGNQAPRICLPLT